MQNLLTIFRKWSTFLSIGFLLAFSLKGIAVFSQIQSVNTVQNLSFGAFTQGEGGGTVIIANDGSRSTTGSVIALNLGMSYFEAVFELEAPEGTIISILNGPDAILTGSNGGSMSLNIGDSSPGAPFISSVAPPALTEVRIGGTLSVGDASASPPGIYSGTFYVTFNNE